MHTAIHRYRAGMPQLAHTGLAENWLLKECGQRHWDALAAHSCRDVPEFFDDEGRRAYASFVAVRVDMNRRHAIRENGTFALHVALHRVGPIRHFSEQRIRCGDDEVGIVRMMSAFVTREHAGSNRSVAKARMSGVDGRTGPVPADALSMAEHAKKLRVRDASIVPALAGLAEGDGASVSFLPCPNMDFNGADLLYFASFQAFVDRAEWQHYRFEHAPVLAARQLYFHGNLDIGDSLTVRFARARTDAGGLLHWSEIVRDSDGAKIADVITQKRWSRP
ncbi:Pnap_2097 family protein [Burkholderia pyrrocinia]|uniref:Pnap_2097 family protein n=1 Tax=Burkholderia pyrrocinia TaxID=60550 RepID=UPI0038B482BD